MVNWFQVPVFNHWIGKGIFKYWMCVECYKFLICFSSVLLTKFSKKVLWTFRDQAPADRHNFSAGYTWSKDANVQKAFG